ncbi:hypothetical protein GW17_00005755 [Ensete ventricosum]|nr:hypothetical protein GW17_00005755 [Ensete ventricosum]
MLVFMTFLDRDSIDILLILHVLLVGTVLCILYIRFLILTLFHVLQEGSRLKVDYEVYWDRDGYFRSVNQKPSRNYRQDRDSSTQVLAGNVRNEPSKHQPHITFDSNGARRKRFRGDYANLGAKLVLQIQRPQRTIQEVPTHSLSYVVSCSDLHMF